MTDDAISKLYVTSNRGKWLKISSHTVERSISHKLNFLTVHGDSSPRFRQKYQKAAGSDLDKLSKEPPSDTDRKLIKEPTVVRFYFK